jgi:hypothetical protein
MKKTVLTGFAILSLLSLGSIDGDQLAIARPVKSTSATGVNTNQLQIISLGSEPRQKVRFTPAVNSKEIMKMTMVMDFKMPGTGSTSDFPIPKMLMQMDVIVNKILPNGDIEYGYVYSDSRVLKDGKTPSSIAADMNKMLKTLVGTKGDVLVGINGVTKRHKIQFSSNLAPSMKSAMNSSTKSLEQFSALRPTEPMGVGAKWIVKGPVKSSDLTINQQATYEVVEIDRQGMKIKSTVNQQAFNLPLKSASNKNTKATIKSMKSVGGGETVLQFDRLMPLKSTLSMTTDSEIVMTSVSKKKPENFKSKLNIRIDMESLTPSPSNLKS